MSKPYWSGAGGRSGSYLDDLDDTPAPRTNGYSSVDSGTGFYSGGGYRTTDEYRDSGIDADDYDEDYDYDDGDYHQGPDIRWRWLAGLALAVLVAAVLAITMVMRSDSTSPAAQTEAAPPATSTAPRTVIATVPPSPVPPPTAQLSPETVVTITTAPPAATVPPVAAPVVPPLAAAPAPPDPRTITYTVTGTRQLIDLVTIIYTDEQGMPRTEVNAALPWSRTVVMNPGVDFESVTATSITGQLNCAITDAAGATLIAQTNNSMLATCTS